MKNIFRTESVKHASKPDQLDTLMSYISPGRWLLVLAILLIVIVVVLWGIFGRIPEQVTGKGVLVRKDSIYKVVSYGSGFVDAINVREGDVVYRGQCLMRIHAIETVEQIRKNRALINFIKELYSLNDKLDRKKRQENLNSIEKEYIHYQKNIANLRKSLKGVKDIYDIYKGLKDKHIVSKVNLISVQQNLMDAEINVINAENKLVDIPYRRYLAQYDFDSSHLYRMEHLKTQLENEMAELRIELQKSEVTSPIYGRVLEVNAQLGDNVQSGAPLLVIIAGEAEDETQVIAYLSPIYGKRVEPLMKVQVSPSIVESERYGSIIGLVKEVGEFPATPDQVMTRLHNEFLQEKMTGAEAPIQATIELLPDPDTKSGFMWTSSKGPPYKVSPGNICTVLVTVEERSPFSYVFPFIQSWLQGKGAVEKRLFKQEK